MSLNHRDLTSFKALSFDCYGTLIDWESGLLATLQPFVTARLSSTSPEASLRSDGAALLDRFNNIERRLIGEHPKMPYPDVLERAWRELAKELALQTRQEGGEDAEMEETVRRLRRGPGEWKAFPDTVDALKRLKKHYKLVILSNVDEVNISRCVRGALADPNKSGDDAVLFDAVYTAEAIGSYKPYHGNFAYLHEHALADLGVDGSSKSGEMLHVARSLTADHVPCAELGLRSAWISRGGDVKGKYGMGGDYEKLKGEGKLKMEWNFPTLGDMANEVERQLAEKTRAG